MFSLSSFHEHTYTLHSSAIIFGIIYLCIAGWVYLVYCRRHPRNSVPTSTPPSGTECGARAFESFSHFLPKGSQTASINRFVVPKAIMENLHKVFRIRIPKSFHNRKGCGIFTSVQQWIITSVLVTNHSDSMINRRMKITEHFIKIIPRDDTEKYDTKKGKGETDKKKRYQFNRYQNRMKLTQYEL